MINLLSFPSFLKVFYNSFAPCQKWGISSFKILFPVCEFKCRFPKPIGAYCCNIPKIIVSKQKQSKIFFFTEVISLIKGSFHLIIHNVLLIELTDQEYKCTCTQLCAVKIATTRNTSADGKHLKIHSYDGFILYVDKSSWINSPISILYVCQRKCWHVFIQSTYKYTFIIIVMIL